MTRFRQSEPQLGRRGFHAFPGGGRYVAQPAQGSGDGGLGDSREFGDV